MFVLPQSAGIAYLLEQIKTDVAGMGELTLVLVDTSVSFFRRQRERQPATYDHARYLRALSMLPGKPAVVVNCHPSASAAGSLARVPCVPRGGSAHERDRHEPSRSGRKAETRIPPDGEEARPGFQPDPVRGHELSIEQHGAKVPTVVAVYIDEDRERNPPRMKRKALRETGCCS